MNKETFIEKLMKRFYGITGPLDEYKRRELDRIGNLCFIYLFWVLLIGNLCAILLADTYPETVAFAYPAILTFCIFLALSYIIYRTHKLHLMDIDEEELTKQEQKKMRFAGLKQGLFFGIFTWIFHGTFNFIDNRPLIESFLSPKSIVILILNTLFMGIFTHFYLKWRKKSAHKND
ncbi:DUF3278 domain-containing protein [Streptococcus pneumoniae]